MSSDPKKRRKEKYRDLADVELPRFFLIPFLKYLKPHKLRLLAAFFGMFIVGFFGSFTILLLKSPLEILFGLNTREQAEEQVAEALDNGREAIRAAIEDWRARAGGAAQAETLSRLEALEAAIAQREAAALAGPSGEHEVAESFIKRIPGVDRLEDWAEAKFGPAKDALKRRKELWDAWMLEHRLETLWLFAAFISAMAIVKAFFEFLSKYLMAHTLYHAVIKIKEDIFRHVMGLDYAFFVRQTTGFLESRISSDVSKIKDIFDALISDAVQQPITLIFLLGLLRRRPC